MENALVYAKVAAYLGAALAISLGTVGPAFAQGMIGSKALENFVQCPEQRLGSFRMLTLLALVIVETCAIYALLIAGGLLLFGYWA